MSQFGKKGGVSIFQKCLKFKNVPKVGGGGGSTLIGTLSQIFSIFHFDGSPKNVRMFTNDEYHEYLRKVKNIRSPGHRMVPSDFYMIKRSEVMQVEKLNETKKSNSTKT